METGGHLGSFSPYLWHDITASTTDVRSVFSKRTPPLQHKPAPPFPPSPHPLSAQRRSHHGTDSLVWSPAPCTSISAREKPLQNKIWPINAQRMGKKCSLWREAESRTHVLWLLPDYPVCTQFSMPSSLHIIFFTVRDSQITFWFKTKIFPFPFTTSYQGMGLKSHVFHAHSDLILMDSRC